MNCWVCNRPSHGICQFCGRALCKDHAKEKLHIVSVFGKETAPHALVTRKALFCGLCQPLGDPVALSDSQHEK